MSSAPATRHEVDGLRRELGRLERRVVRLEHEERLRSYGPDPWFWLMIALSILLSVFTIVAIAAEDDGEAPESLIDGVATSVIFTPREAPAAWRSAQIGSSAHVDDRRPQVGRVVGGVLVADAATADAGAAGAAEGRVLLPEVVDSFTRTVPTRRSSM